MTASSTLPNGFPAIREPYTGPQTGQQLSALDIEQEDQARREAEARQSAAAASDPPRGAGQAAAGETAGRHRHQPGQRTSAMYQVITALWILLCIPMLAAAVPVIEGAFRRSGFLGGADTATTAFIMYFWLNGMKDVVYPVAYRVTSWRRQAPARRPPGPSPLVGLLYVTCNDFSAASLTASARQHYGNFEVCILDDTDPGKYPARIAEVDGYARRHGIPVFRRPDRPAGFKAGNLNYFLQSPHGRRFDYFAILDSDEVIPPEFTARCLDYFADPGVGIVQANHAATRNRTSFMKMFAPGVDAHWPAYQQVKNHAGFLSLLGHGAMVSREAYTAAGGFPGIVAEDIGFAIDALRGGYRTAFAQDVLCEEEFPVDYAAFETRHRKWTEGNMEFIRAYARRILFSRQLRWFEKLDIILFTFSLPLTGVFSAYVVVNAIVFPLMHFSNRFPLWMLAPTVVFLVAPMFNDMMTWRHVRRRRLVSYLLHSVALFGSVYFASLFASVRTTFGGSVFHVTPKEAGKVSLRSALAQNRVKLIASVVLATAVEAASGSVLAVILIIIPAFFGVYLSVMNAGDPPPAESGGGHVFQETE